METPTYFPLFIIFFYFLTRQFLRKFQNLPPSPFLALPIIGHLHLLYLKKKTLFHRTLAKISNQYGPVLLLQFGSRPVLLVSSPSAAEECFSKNDIVFANRPRTLAGQYLGYNYTTVVWASYGQHWRNLRRIASIELLSTARVQSFSSFRVHEVRSLLRHLYRGSSSRDGEFYAVEIKSVFLELTFNTMMRMIAGKSYYGDNNIAGLEETRRFKEILAGTFRLSGPNIGDYVPLLKWVGRDGLEKELRMLQEKRDGFMQDLIEEHRRTMSDHHQHQSCSDEQQTRKTMIDMLLSLQENDPEYYSDEIIRGMMLVLLTAGSDTSAGTMEWALSLLLNNPEALKKAQAEIDIQIGQQGCRLIEESDLTHLPYLRAIIKETLRICPAAPLIPAHESSEECTVGGYRVPRGTMLLVNAWAIQNDPRLWGGEEEPTKFKPERFLNSEVNMTTWMPFGCGRRGCPGEGLAMRMVGLALGSLIQCFEWERVDGEEMVDLREGTGFTMPKAQPLVAKCRSRRTMVNLLSQL